MIDGATNTTTPVTVGSQPNAVAVNPVTDKIYVADYGDGTVTVIDRRCDECPEPMAVGQKPTVVAVDPATNKIYVVNSNDGTLTILDGTNNNSPRDADRWHESVRSCSRPGDQQDLRVQPGNPRCQRQRDGYRRGHQYRRAIRPDASGPCSVAVNAVKNKVYVAW